MKTKYNADEFPKLVEMWCRKGLSDKQIYKNLGIGRESYYKYLRMYKEFAEARKRGKAPVDFEVENAMLKRALGYEYEETHTEIRKAQDGRQHTVVKKIKKQVAPDVGAQIFWLKNRQPDRWKDKVYHVTGEDKPIMLTYKLDERKTPKKDEKTRANYKKRADIK